MCYNCGSEIEGEGSYVTGAKPSTKGWIGKKTKGSKDPIAGLTQEYIRW